MPKWIRLAEEAGVSFVTFPYIGLRRYLEGVRRVVGVEGEAVLAYEAAKDAARQIVDLLRKEWKLNGENLLKASLELLEEMGIGRLTLVLPRLKLRRKIVVRIEGSYIAKGVAKRSDRPVCHLIKGTIAGGLEALTGWKMDAEETKCLAMGDEYCEFTVKRVESST